MRNEQANIGACLQSLLAQDDEDFKLGRDWEMIVVDDDSTDDSRRVVEEILAQRMGAQMLSAPALELQGSHRAFTGKTNACWAGAQASTGKWILFTDADTTHEPGNLQRAMHEAERHHAALLSYSPLQRVSGFWQRALMPLIFSELASVYPPRQVNDPADKLAAANGQFLLIEREAYFAVGGHRMVGRSVLEDVDLAENVKRSRRNIRFRYAPDALSTRMYRGFGDMMEGWTKNLYMLFPHALMLAAWRALDIVLLLLPVLLYTHPYLLLWQRTAIVLIWLRTLWRFYHRVARSNFSVADCALSIFALPLFVYVLVKSWAQHRYFHRIAWKGRTYRSGR
jgi:glycosyltransferase involved in cell wall biosynthesis